MRHYKAKRDMILRVLGKATFINGSQFVITWISPKGDVDVFASEMLQSSATRAHDAILNKEQLGKEAKRVKTELTRRWDELAELEAKGEAPTMEEAGEDPDQTLVDDFDFKFDEGESSAMAVAGSVTTPAVAQTATVPPTTTPGTQITLAPEQLDEYYTNRFEAMQQNTCKLVVKQWIKIIEPKKQMKFPYNGGEGARPTWWPEGVKHREPDHLSKTGRSMQ